MAFRLERNKIGIEVGKYALGKVERSEQENNNRPLAKVRVVENIAVSAERGSGLVSHPRFFYGAKLQQTAQARKKEGECGAHASVKRYVVEAPLSLNLSQCQGELEIPAVGFSGGSLEINGDTVTLTSGDGRVIAYARSAHYFDSSVSLSFMQTRAPVSSAEWKPPLTVSLLLIQSRKNHREVIVSPVRGALTSSAPARLRCMEASAVAK